MPIQTPFERLKPFLVDNSLAMQPAPFKPTI
jgi:hypothetical protein